MEHIKDILDQVQIWHICVAAYIIGAIWLIWEAKNAPLMPDEYDLPAKKDDTDFEDDYENQPFGD